MKNQKYIKINISIGDLFNKLNIDNNKDTCYMNKRGHFDIPLDSLEVKVYINYRDAKEGKIVYQAD